MLRRILYGVGKDELGRFVSENECVQAWLGKYAEGRSRRGYARILCRFFKWLRIVKGLEISPKGLLNEQLKLSTSLDIGDRKRHLNLVLQHTRDNPDFKNFGIRRKLNGTELFLSVCCRAV